MSESNHLKCPCQQCGATIEFPADGVGLAVNCPHCDQQTLLFVPPQAENEDASSLTDNPSPAKGQRNAVVVLLLVVAVTAAGAFVFRERLIQSRPEQGSQDTPTNEHAVTVEPPVLRTNPPASAKITKSIDDLKVGPIALEKTKGSSLVYVVGVLRNDSGHQRFGVNIELDLTDARGNRAGTAKDYRAVLEPRQEWRFRALVLDAKAVSARVAAIREEE